MSKIFPQPIKDLPEANIPINGITAYLSQSETHQIIFMEFENDVDLPEHSHATQVGFVLEGSIELIINGEKKVFSKGYGSTFR
jgi:quercetin dioxygenase-like cupin family protein